MEIRETLKSIHDDLDDMTYLRPAWKKVQLTVTSPASILISNTLHLLFFDHVSVRIMIFLSFVLYFVLNLRVFHRFVTR